MFIHFFIFIKKYHQVSHIFILNLFKCILINFIIFLFDFLNFLFRFLNLNSLKKNKLKMKLIKVVRKRLSWVILILLEWFQLLTLFLYIQYK